MLCLILIVSVLCVSCVELAMLRYSNVVGMFLFNVGAAFGILPPAIANSSFVDICINLSR